MHHIVISARILLVRVLVETLTCTGKTSHMAFSLLPKYPSSLNDDFLSIKEINTSSFRSLGT